MKSIESKLRYMTVHDKLLFKLLFKLKHMKSSIKLLVVYPFFEQVIDYMILA